MTWNPSQSVSQKCKSVLTYTVLQHARFQRASAAEKALDAVAAVVCGVANFVHRVAESVQFGDRAE